MTVIGKRVQRLEDGPLVMGQGRYVANVSFPNELHMRVVRAGYAHGELNAIDASSALALPDLIEIRLLTMRGRRLWRLKQADGQVLLVPVDAAGAERLFDAFASLPGLGTADLLAALTPAGAGAGETLPGPDATTRVVWRRAGVGMVRGDAAARP